MTTTQPEFPFASLDFPGRSTLTVAEVAKRTGFCTRHIEGLIDVGSLVALNGANPRASKRALRIVVESYRDWIVRGLTGPAAIRSYFLAHLPEDTKRDLYNELGRYLGRPAA